MTHDYRPARSRPALNHLLGLTLGALLLRSSFLGTLEGYPTLPLTSGRLPVGLDTRNKGSRLGRCMVEPGVLLSPLPGCTLEPCIILCSSTL